MTQVSEKMDNINIKFENQQQVADYADKNGRVLVVLDEYVLDATSFAEHHPGGGSLIHNYRSKKIDEQMKFHQPLALIMANSLVVGTFKKDIQRLIDPEQPLMRQVWDLTHEQYLKIVDSPHWLFVPSPRMFETDFCEFFAHNKWYAILLLPFLVINYMLYNVVSWEGVTPPKVLGSFLLGVFFFSLTEYFLHRFIFHS